jgi:hypothetical protein
MGRFLAGVGLATMFAWFFRRLRKPQPAPAQPDPAEELKQKLAESRTEEATPPPEPDPEPEQSVGIDERRREVHERAQAAIDQMRDPPPTG